MAEALISNHVGRETFKQWSAMGECASAHRVVICLNQWRCLSENGVGILQHILHGPHAEQTSEKNAIGRLLRDCIGNDISLINRLVRRNTHSVNLAEANNTTQYSCAECVVSSEC